MKPDKKVMEMTNKEIFENYDLFCIKPEKIDTHKSFENNNPLFFYNKCFVHRDDGVQYSNSTCEL